MRRLLRLYLSNCLALAVVSYLVSGITIEGGVISIFIIGGLLTLMNIFLKPVLKVFTLPLNFISLGFFSWVLNVIILFLLTKIISQFKISEFDFSGFTNQGFSIPAFHFGWIETLVLGTVFISLITNLLRWITEDD